jgi:hypothetical protein
MACWPEAARLIESDGWCCGLVHFQLDPGCASVAGPLDNGFDQPPACSGPSVGRIDPHSSERSGFGRLIENPDRHRHEFVGPRGLHEGDPSVVWSNSLSPIGLAEPCLLFEGTPERAGRFSYRL